MPVEAIGCCGAYCGTCQGLKSGNCRGCKFGYISDERDIISDFYSKNGYKYKKYKQDIEYIKDDWYDGFLKIADSWKNAYGKYK